MESATSTALRKMAALAREQEAAGDDEDEAEPYDPADGRWSHTDMLLGAVVDEIRVNTHVLVTANSTSKPRPPEALRRPGYGRKPVKTRKRRKLTPEQRRSIDPRARQGGDES